eukprot:10698001-Heterocapsa_arctica.AAC.1
METYVKMCSLMSCSSLKTCSGVACEQSTEANTMRLGRVFARSCADLTVEAVVSASRRADLSVTV